MAKRKKSVEVLPNCPFEVITGSTKDSTFRVSKNGSNYVCPKVTMEGNKGGREGVLHK